MTVHNSKPKPRALFIGFDEDDLKANGIIDLFPTYKVMEDVDELEGVRQTEFELVITYDEHNLSSVDQNLFVVSLGGEDLGQRTGKDKKPVVLAVKYHESVATEFLIDDGLDERIYKLVSQTLLPIYKEEDSHSVLSSMSVQSSSYVGKHYMPIKAWASLLSDGDGKVLSGYTHRSEETGTELWYLHPSLSRKNLKRWLELLLERWAAINPAAFPNSGNWRTDPKWQSSEEVSVNGEIEALKSNFAAQNRAYQASLTALDEKMALATKSAETSSRVLLTSQGDTLKAAVKNTLEGFGFTVTDVDKELETDTKSSDKLEDLRASTSVKDKADWIALVEVRGYVKGAKLNDLLRLSRFTKRYMQETGGIPPSAVWYIANHDFNDKPDNRQLALKDSPNEVKEFGKDQGLVIDTVELFKLKRAVDDGVITPEEARTLLMSSSEAFKYRKRTV